MPRPRTGTKITISIPDDLMRLAELQGEVMGLERYDILRLAIAQGLVVLRIQHEIVSDPDTYKKDLVALSTGDITANASLAEKLEENLAKGIKAQIQKREEKARAE